MRATTITVAVILSAAALAGCGQKVKDTASGEGSVATTTPASAPAAKTLPTRKPGLWEQTMTMAGGTSRIVKLCTDEAFEKKVSWAGGQMAGAICTEQSMTPGASGGWTFHSVCDMGTGGKTVTDGVASGDFSSQFEIKTTSTTTGAAVPQMNGAHEMTMMSVWKGACPADWKPGDTEMPGAGRINVGDMMVAGAKAVAAPTAK